MTSAMLADMQSVKMLGLSGFFGNVIQKHRVEETQKMTGYRWCIVVGHI
jgi:ATP-binding cassette subfamily C (CFTR/MRP) protein 1